MTFDGALATLCGIGRAPVAPGTVASAVAALLAWPLAAHGGPAGVLAGAAIASLLGVWACSVHARRLGVTDPSECVIDELAGQWLACAFAPLSFEAFLLAFVLFRVFDIWKPGPIRRLEKLPGGYGIMADDLAAGLLAGILVAAAAWAGLV
jgi:phosphatidylglycerophosphatase A